MSKSLSPSATRAFLHRAVMLLDCYKTGVIYAMPGIVAAFLTEVTVAMSAKDIEGAIGSLAQKTGRPKGRLDSQPRELSLRTKRIIARLDSGEAMKQIAQLVGVSEQYVSSVKRRHRPDTANKRGEIIEPFLERALRLSSQEKL